MVKSAISLPRKLRASNTCFSVFKTSLLSITSLKTSLHFAASVLRANSVFRSVFHSLFPKMMDLREPPSSVAVVRICAASW